MQLQAYRQFEREDGERTLEKTLPFRRIHAECDSMHLTHRVLKCFMLCGWKEDPPSFCR